MIIIKQINKQMNELDKIWLITAMTHVKVSNDLENYTYQVNTLGVLH